MAVSDSSKLDLLYKKLFGVSKSDTSTNKAASNEATASPSLLRGDIIWLQSDQIPSTAASVANIVQSYNSTSRIQCTSDTTSSPVSSIYPTWKTGLTDWISPEFGPTYFVKAYYGDSGLSNPAASGGTQFFDSGSGGTGEWWFDYQAGTLNFIGGTNPAGMTSSHVVYIYGYRYIGTKGVYPSQADNSGKYLTTNGTNVSWGTVSTYSSPTLGSTLIGSGSTVTSVSALTLNNGTLTGSLTAGAGTGTSGQVLQSTGSGVQWATVSGGEGGSGTTTNALTIGTGLSGTSFNGSAAVTIAIDSTVSTLTGTQTLTNKTINGSENTITNVSLASGVTGTLPVANGGTGITSLGTGIATFLGTPSSANFASVITDETGSGALVFGTSPTISNLTLSGSLTAGAGTGTSGQVLQSTGSGVQWATVSGVGGTTTNALTIGTGLSGTSFDGSSAVTVAIDSTVVTTSGTQTLINKTLTTPTIDTPLLTLSTTSSTTDGRIAWDSTNDKILVGGTLNSVEQTVEFASSTLTISTPTFTTNAYTVVLSDKDKWLELSNGATAGTLNIPTDATANFAIGTQLNILQTGAGQITIAAVTPGTTTVNGTPGLKLRGQWSAATIVKRSADTWVAVGDLSA
jgi:hypothetical protein